MAICVLFYVGLMHEYISDFSSRFLRVEYNISLTSTSVSYKQGAVSRTVRSADSKNVHRIETPLNPFFMTYKRAEIRKNTDLSTLKNRDQSNFSAARYNVFLIPTQFLTEKVHFDKI